LTKKAVQFFGLVMAGRENVALYDVAVRNIFIRFFGFFPHIMITLGVKSIHAAILPSFLSHSQNLKVKVWPLECSNNSDGRIS
jgi:hypothetical protein